MHDTRIRKIWAGRNLPILAFRPERPRFGVRRLVAAFKGATRRADQSADKSAHSKKPRGPHYQGVVRVTVALRLDGWRGAALTSFPGEAGFAFASSGVAEGFVECAVVSFLRICEHAVDDLLCFLIESFVGSFAFADRLEHLSLQIENACPCG